MTRLSPRSVPALLLLALGAAGCVNVDPDTNEVIPRGDQYFKFEEVERRAEKLQIGMAKLEVQGLLGSPAEKTDRGNVWVYVPERAAVLIPGRALKLEFESGRLKDHGYHAIVLGARL